MKFFEDVAQRYGLQLEAEMVEMGVARYRKLFFDTGEAIEKGEEGVLMGLVLLWGTEKVGVFFFLFSFVVTVSLCCTGRCRVDGRVGVGLGL